MMWRQNLQEVGSEWPCSNFNFAYLCLEVRWVDFLVGCIGSFFFLGTGLEAPADFFTVFDAFDFSFFSVALDLLLCECLTGVMYAEVRLTLANWSPLSTRT